MNSINTKRLLKDIKDLEKNNLQSHGIHYIINDDDIYNLKVLMIGPENTPYQFGFYLFDVKIPPEYPFKPPIVKFCTQNNKTRFNPNLYINGKVCLSILNTWSGPQWTSCNNISSVLLSIQSMVFISNPLHNEPGFENDKSVRNKNYNILITYENFNTAICNILINIPCDYILFMPIITKSFLDNYNNIIDKIEQHYIYNNKLIDCSIYTMKDVIDYNKVKNQLIKLYNNLIEKN
tara:strand:+ start:3266 stop:3970 length:705 start_codon:yes stop_codon:yes gene_type:complete